MGKPEQQASLSQIETRWSLVLQAGKDRADGADSAQRELMERYAGAVHRYLLCVTQDTHAAADLAQEFALRFLRGDFHRADPRRGRFRSYLKRAVLNLVIDAYRTRKKSPRPLPADGDDLCAPVEDLADLDRQFLDCWRDELLGRSWARLAAAEDAGGPPYFTTLRARADNPSLRSHELAGRLSVPLGKNVNAGWVRQTLLRARDRFVEILRDEVSQSLGHPGEEECDEEMRDLGLFAYCGQRKKARELNASGDTG